MLALLEVKGTFLMDREHFAGQFPHQVFDRPTIILPELIVDDFTKDPKTLLLLLIDTFWQAGGHRRSPYYNRPT